MVTKKKTLINRRCTYVFFVATFFVFWMLYLQAPTKPDQTAALSKTEYISTIDLRYLVTNLSLQYNESENVELQYLVHSTKCKIRSLNPYNPEILPYYSPKKYVLCRKKPLLTYVKKENNIATLYVNNQVAKDYADNGNVYCCISEITRGKKFENSGTPDTLIDVSSCQSFTSNATLKSDYVLVKCFDDYNKEVYKNAHAVVTVKKQVKEKIKQFEDVKNEHLSVLFVGVDSISRMNLVRSLPLTHLFLKENDWLDFKGYNKMGDNTFPNVMAILTGLNESSAFKFCNPRVVGPLDKCKMLWYDYQKLGFVTGYGEDEAEISTFNYMKKGFRHEPTDYYFRPYILGTEHYLHSVPVDVVKYCTGPETAGERIFNLAKEFTTTFKNYSNFGFFWMNSYSHNEINAVSRMDKKIAEFMIHLNTTEILDNSVVIFISDHGFRFGSITYTHAGWLEERLPFFYMSVPKWFKKRYPRMYENLITNTERLTSPYDVYMTLQDILVISGKNYTIKQSTGCPKCRSLFEEEEKERSCEDAGIEHHWCTCGNYLTIPSTKLIAEEAAKFIISEIHKAQINTGNNFRQCLDFKLNKIISAGISDANYTLKNITYFLITFQTEPEAVFQGTISLNMNLQTPTFKMEGSVSRLDVYAEHSWCVNDSVLKKYCYCESTFKFLFWNLVEGVQTRLNLT